MFAGSYFQSTSNYSLVNWAWTSDFIYKLYPDVLTFYFALAFIALASICLQMHIPIRKFLHRRAWVRECWTTLKSRSRFKVSR